MSMTRDAIDARPKAVAAELCRVAERSVPDLATLRDLAHQLLQRHALLGLKPVVSSEEVVEAYFRCVITDGLMARYTLDTVAVPNCINSSHRAVRRVCASPAHCHAKVEDDAWLRGWLGMQHRNPEVNIHVAGHSPKRADLYVAATDGVVSVEFKYVGPAGVRDVRGCAAQLGRHAAHHSEVLLLLYSGTQVPEDVMCSLAQQAGSANVRTLNVTGPGIPVTRGAA